MLPEHMTIYTPIFYHNLFFFINKKETTDSVVIIVQIRFAAIITSAIFFIAIHVSTSLHSVAEIELELSSRFKDCLLFRSRFNHVILLDEYP